MQKRVRKGFSQGSFRFWPQKSALILVDPLVDFFPGGAFPVWDAPQRAEAMNELLNFNFGLRILLQDWHPKNHCSFKYLPVHCVQDSQGAEVHPAIVKGPRRKLWHGWFDHVVQKGTARNVDAYSGFFDRRGWPVANEALHKLLVKGGFEYVVVGGLEAGHCVLDTVLHGMHLNHRMVVVREAVGSLSSRGGLSATGDMEQAGALILSLNQLEIG